MTQIPGNTSTTAVISGSGNTAGQLEFSGDSDWFRIELTAGLTYDFQLRGDGSATSLDRGRIVIVDAQGNDVNTAGSWGEKGTTIYFTPAQSGTYYIAIEDPQADTLAEGSYVIRSRMNDTVIGNNSTTAEIGGTGIVEGDLGQERDADWYRVTLTEGLSYSFGLTGTGGAGSLDSGRILLVDANGNTIQMTGKGGTVSHTAVASGTYYVVIEDGQADREAEGLFRIDARMSDQVVANTNTTATLTQGGRTSGQIEAVGDSDWIGFSMRDGLTYSFALAGTGGANALDGKRLIIRDENGANVGQISGDGTIRGNFTASDTGRYYLDVQGSGGAMGQYQLSVISTAPVLTGTAGADYLAGGQNATRINGWAGNDTLLGNGGNDRLDGGTGNDVISGGVGNDVFLFGRGDDKDRITDFVNNRDAILLDVNGIDTVREALAKAKQVGGNVVFDFGQGDTLTVVGVTKAMLVDDLIIG